MHRIDDGGYLIRDRSSGVGLRWCWRGPSATFPENCRESDAKNESFRRRLARRMLAKASTAQRNPGAKLCVRNG